MSLLLSLLLLAGAIGYTALAVYVLQNRDAAGALPLAAFLAAVGIWTISYGLELSATDVATARIFSGVKYLGITLLPVSLIAFVHRWTAAGRPLRRSVVVALLVPPAVVMTLLALPQTRDLVHTYPVTPRHVFGSPVPEAGPLFWVQAAWEYSLLVLGTVLLVFRVARVARPYRRQALALALAAVLPLAGNLLYNLEKLPILLDPTPFLFTVTAVVLVWGTFRLRLLDLAPVARRLVVERMGDAVLVLDAFDRVADANPAAEILLGMHRSHLVGRLARDTLPALAPALDAQQGSAPAHRDLELDGPSVPMDVEVSVSAITDQAGRRTARVAVLRDVSARRDAERRLAGLLEEQTRLAEVLQQSLRPGTLTDVPGLRIAARWEPAHGHPDDLHQVSGDFYDVHRALAGRHAFVIGDVSGKGVHAAVVTSLARYTLRALSAEGRSPAEALRGLNAALMADGDVDRFATVAYGHLQPRPDGTARVRLALAGHPPLLLRHRDGTVAPVGEPGTLLGLVGEVEVSEVQVDLSPGQVLLAFTDGVTEARRDRAMFGEERLAEVLAGLPPDPDAVVDGVLGAVHAWSDRRDDLALLALAVPEPVQTDQGWAQPEQG